MKRTTLFLIVLAVISAHALFFWLVANEKVLPQKPYVAPPNFGSRSAEIVDSNTGEKAIYREFTVSTKLQNDLSAQQN